MSDKDNNNAIGTDKFIPFAFNKKWRDTDPSNFVNYLITLILLLFFGSISATCLSYGIIFAIEGCIGVIFAIVLIPFGAFAGLFALIWLLPGLIITIISKRKIK